MNTETRRMKGTVRFEYDRVNDVHLAYPNWTIETDEDCKQWAKQYADYFGKFGRRVDVVFVHDALKISVRVGELWGKYRVEILRRYTRFSARVGGDRRVSTFAATSAIRNGVTSQEASSVPDALRLIQARRREVA